jgi:DNA-binding IclR family transcriptional regulator
VTSLAKMLDVLTLFTASEPVLTAEDIIKELNYTRPTTYRYVRELCAAGLLTRFNKGYALGPRVIELDYIIRQADPVLKVSKSTMRALADRYGCEVVLLSMFGAKVVTVHEEKGKDFPQVSFGRGHPMPLFLGAGSKVMTAFLPAAKQKKLFVTYPAEVAASKLGTDWPKFHASLRKIRAAGFAVSVGELDPANVGVAAPILGEGGEARGSLVLILSETRYQIADKPLLLDTLKGAAARISERIADEGSFDEHGLVLPATRASRG